VATLVRPGRIPLLVVTLFAVAAIQPLADISFVSDATAGSRYGRSVRHQYRYEGVRMRRTKHNSKGPRRYNTSRAGTRKGHYRHGSVRSVSGFKSSAKYGPPRKYNPYGSK